MNPTRKQLHEFMKKIHDDMKKGLKDPKKRADAKKFSKNQAKKLS